MDLVEGRYPGYEEEWVLDGQPYPPNRRTISRRDIMTGTSGISGTGGTTLAVYAVAVQPGDIFGAVSFVVQAAGATLTHSWVALYNGVATGAALLAQTADNTTATGWSTGLQHLPLVAASASVPPGNVAQPGTPQGLAGGPGQWPIVPFAAAVYGIAVYQAGTTANKLDGMAGGSLAGEVTYTGQPPLLTTGTLAATATAPAVLPTMAAAIGGIPYLVLSRS